MKLKPHLLIFTSLLLAWVLLIACSKQPRQSNNNSSVANIETTVQRPREAWVVRSVLDLKPRMLSIALHENLYVAYNTQTGSSYKAWRGSIDFDGPVYTAAHGPQPTSKGDTYYLLEPDGNPWRLIENGQEITPEIRYDGITPEIRYDGHSITNNQVTLKYRLKHGSKFITVEEKPEYFNTALSENAGLSRSFSLANVPAGVQVGLKMQLAAATVSSGLKTNGQLTQVKKQTETQNGKEYEVVNGLFLLQPDKTNLEISLTPRPVKKEKQVEGMELVVANMMARSDCNTCHNLTEKTVGPSYTAIAQRYENNEENTDALVSKVIKGGAGNWGNIPMTPHPNLNQKEAGTIVSYILGLDAEEEKVQTTGKFMPQPDFAVKLQSLNPNQVKSVTEQPGLAINIYQFGNGYPLTSLPDITPEMLPARSGSINVLHLSSSDFGSLANHFALHATGNINIEKTTNIVFRLVSDEGSRLYLDNKLVLDNSENKKLAPKDAEIILEPGKHPVKVEFFQGKGDKTISLQWRPYGTGAFTVVPPNVLSFKGSDIKRTQDASLVIKKAKAIPGDTYPLENVHPSFTLTQARPSDFKPKVGGMDFLPDGRLVVSTWDSLGSVYILDNLKDSNPQNIKVKRIAFGLAEPLGLKVVDGNIYVMQKQELTRLVDKNNDELIDEYQTLCNGWQVSPNFHEFAFGLVYRDGYFYGTLATAINPGGASTKPQIPDRGKVIKISKKDGSFSFIATGLRTPNGISEGIDNEIFIADNQGDWLPASKIVHLQEGAWYGSRSVDFEGTAKLKETPPVVWLPQSEIGNSPSQPIKINVGPYKNQMLHGEVTHGGIKRVFMEKVNGQYQGVVFRFTQGLEAGVNRLTWGPDNALYIGGVGSTGNWAHAGKLPYGLQKLTYNNQSTFEMLAVRAKANGLEIEFTEPLKAGTGQKATDYGIKQWWYKPTQEYGGPKMDLEELKVKNITLSADRKKVFLELAGLKPKHLVYIRLNRNTIVTGTDKKLWSTEAWYTLNNIPAEPGKLSQK